MATLTPQSTSGSAAGALVTYVAATAGGDSILARGSNVVLLVNNASAGAVTVTVAGVTPCSQGFTHSQVFTCPVGTSECPIPTWTANSTTGLAAVTYSAVASVTVAAVSN